MGRLQILLTAETQGAHRICFLCFPVIRQNNGGLSGRKAKITHALKASHVALNMLVTKMEFNLYKRKLFLGRPLNGPGKLLISLRPLRLERSGR